MKARSFAIQLVLGAALLTPILPAAGATLPDRFVLTIKTGFLHLVDDSQSIAGATRAFDDSANNPFAVEGEWRPVSGDRVSIGGEILRYSNRFGRVGVPGAANEDRVWTHAVLVKSKYFFGSDQRFQPYLGGGIGLSGAYDDSGPIEGVAQGIAAQAVIGMRLRGERVGFNAEYMYLHARAEDDKGDKIDTSSHGVFLGVSFFFARR